MIKNGNAKSKKSSTVKLLKQT